MEHAIKAVSNYIVRAAGPYLIMIFGSMAHGTHNARSDIDLLIVMENKLLDGDSMAKKIISFVRECGFSADVIIVTKDVFERRKRNSSDLLGFIAETGKILFQKK